MITVLLIFAVVFNAPLALVSVLISIGYFESGDKWLGVVSAAVASIFLYNLIILSGGLLTFYNYFI